MTLGVVTSLILMLGLGAWYSIRVGRKLQEADRFDSYKKTAKDINEFNAKEDTEKAKVAANVSGDPIISPWLRRRK